MAAARGADEAAAWRHPVDLVVLCEERAGELQDCLMAGLGQEPWTRHAPLAETLLGDDPPTLLHAVVAAAGPARRRPISGRSLAMRLHCG